MGAAAPDATANREVRRHMGRGVGVQPMPASPQPSPDRMSWLSRLFGGKSEKDARRLDYLKEALALEKSGDLDAAVTSYRLALREKPDDHKTLMNMAIAYSRLSRLDEAIRCYRRALDVDPSLAAAHYGLAFLLIKRQEREEAARHLEAFLAAPSPGADPANIEHARRALDELREPVADDPPAQAPDPGP